MILKADYGHGQNYQINSQ